MNIKTKQFQILTDINLVWNFMTDIYDPYFANGAAAPFSSMRLHLNGWIKNISI